MKEAATKGHTTATDLADYLVLKGQTFRDAHALVGRAVTIAEKNNLQLSDLSLKSLQELCSDIKIDVFDILTVDGSVKSRNHIGGTAPMQVIQQIKQGRDRHKERK